VKDTKKTELVKKKRREVKEAKCQCYRPGVTAVATLRLHQQHHPQLAVIDLNIHHHLHPAKIYQQAHHVTISAIVLIAPIDHPIRMAFLLLAGQVDHIDPVMTPMTIYHRSLVAALYRLELV
jgi:hypothetical protein